jgi:hypothetical protein
MAAVQLRRGGGFVIGAGLAQHEVSLVDLVDRVLGKGVVLHGEITLAVADVDLVRISLRALLASIGTLDDEAGGAA